MSVCVCVYNCIKMNDNSIDFLNRASRSCSFYYCSSSKYAYCCKYIKKRLVRQGMENFHFFFFISVSVQKQIGGSFHFISFSFHFVIYGGATKIT